MSISRYIEEKHILEDEVLQFVTDHLMYYAVTSSGLRLDIVRSHSIQPPIRNEEDYCTFLWLETAQGFFILRQRINRTAPQAWSVIRQLVPVERYNFYFQFLEELEALLVSDFVELGPLV